MNLEYFYYQTPDDCDTREKCWDDLGKYIANVDKKGFVVLRVTPEVVSERDFDTKMMKHRGFVRGWILPREQSDNLVGFGAA